MPTFYFPFEGHTFDRQVFYWVMQFQNASEAVSFAIRSIFERWTALVLTMEHQQGGSSAKARDLLGVTVAMATHPSKRHEEQDYIDMFYAEFDRMHTDIEDGSPEEVAAHILRIRDAASRGNFGPAAEAVGRGMTAGPAASICGQNSEGNEDHEEEVTVMDVIHQSNGPEMDEDGFVSVRRSRRIRKPTSNYIP